MKQLERIMFEVYKNFKLIFRNWSSLALIILAPLLLILIVGYSFSGETLHDIRIGVTTENNIPFEDFARNVSNFAQILQYSNVNDCKKDLTLQFVHICLEIKGDLSEGSGGVPSGEVVFYYDNTRKRTSLLLITQIKEFFGLTAERISLVSTEQIFDNLQEMLDFMRQRIAELEEAKSDAQDIKAKLEERKVKLVQLRDEFMPRYEQVKSIQERLHSYRDELGNYSDSIQVSAQEINSAVEFLRALDSNLTENVSLEPSLTNLESNVNSIVGLTTVTTSELDNLISSVEETVAVLDLINSSLAEEIDMNDKYVELIGGSSEKIEAVLTEANLRMENLSQLDPALAARIAKPITQSFMELKPGLKDIQLGFPILLSTIIIFISIIFANIITSMELNSRAYMRNILAPVNDIIYTTGMALTNFIIVSIQVVVLMIVAQTRFKVDVLSNLPALIPVIILLIFLFVFVGMILAYMSKNMQTSILVATFVSLGFFLFSDILNALESMPVIAAKIAALNPVVIVNSLFRKIVFFSIPLSDMSAGLFSLLLYAGGMGILLVIVSKIKNRQRL